MPCLPPWSAIVITGISQDAGHRAAEAEAAKKDRRARLELRRRCPKELSGAVETLPPPPIS